VIAVRAFTASARAVRYINVRAGTLDDTTWLLPVAHIFLRSAQPWVLPAADAECHEIGPDDYRPLAEKWRATWLDFFPQK